MKSLFLLLLSLLALLPARAQTGKIRGTVYDPMMERGVSGAKVTLLSPDGTMIDTVRTFYHQEIKYTSFDGFTIGSSEPQPTVPADYFFSEKNAGAYTIKIEADGFDTVTQPINAVFTGREGAFDCPAVNLYRPSKVLGEATVTGTRLKMVWKGDTLIYDAAAIQTSEGDMLGNLIERLPGARIENDGKIYVNDRYVETLLINGKDFFNGDVKQALASLPAFTVNKIKTYERAGEKSLTTGSDMHDRQYVMDVHMKREYTKTWSGRLAAYGGTDNRYKVSANVMRIDDRQAFSLLGEMNNINLQSAMWGNESWESGSGEGAAYHRAAFANYHFEPSQKFRFGASGNIKNRHVYTQSSTATETYLAQGNTYGRSAASEKAVSTSAYATTNLTYRPAKGWFTNGNYSVQYSKDHTKGFDRSASYLQNPDRWFASDALDNTFLLADADLLMKNYVQSILRQQTLSRSRQTKQNAGVQVQRAFGIDLLTLAGEWERNNEVTRRYELYDLRYPHATDAAPDFRHRYYEISSLHKQGTFRSSYDYKYLANDSIDGMLSFHFNITHERDDSHNPLYLLNNVPGYEQGSAIDLLPSTRAALLDAIDAPHSYYSRQTSTHYEACLNFTHTQRFANHSWLNIFAQVPFAGDNRTLSYERNYLPYHAHRSTLFFNPQVLIAWHPVRDDRYGQQGQIQFHYDTNGYAPTIISLLDMRNDDDPLSTTVGNPNLKNSRSHDVSLSLNRTFRKSQFQIYLYGRHYFTKNDVATRYTYNSQTGASLLEYLNIDGNHESNFNVALSRPLDKKQWWYLRFSIDNSWQQSRDLNYRDLAAEVENADEISTVKTYTLNQAMNLQFNNNKSVYMTLNVNASRRHISGDRADFTTINAWDVNYVLYGSFKMPWELRLTTSFTASSRYGYSDASLNDTRYLWNATFERAFKKGFTLYAEAHDILHSNRAVTTTLNAQGRVERYARTLPAYFLVGLSWRFTKVQGKKGNAAKLNNEPPVVYDGAVDFAG